MSVAIKQDPDESVLSQVEDGHEDIELEGLEEEDEDEEDEEDESDEEPPMDEDLDSPNTKEYFQQVYEKYQQRFDRVYTKSDQLFNLEKSQRKSLHYYQRRNNALLKVLEQYENAEEQPSGDYLREGIELENARIQRLIQKVPRLAPTLETILDLQSGHNLAIDNTHLVNLYVTESIPELINDDLLSIEVNPQDTYSWCRRNYPNLIATKFRPIKLPAHGLEHEYVKGDILINFPTPEAPEDPDVKKKKRSVLPEGPRKKVKHE